MSPLERNSSALTVWHRRGRGVEPMRLQGGARRRGAVWLEAGGCEAPRSLSSLPRPERRASMPAGDMALPPQPIALSWRLSGLTSQRPGSFSEADGGEALPPWLADDAPVYDTAKLPAPVPNPDTGGVLLEGGNGMFVCVFGTSLGAAGPGWASSLHQHTTIACDIAVAGWTRLLRRPSDSRASATQPLDLPPLPRLHRRQHSGGAAGRLPGAHQPPPGWLAAVGGGCPSPPAAGSPPVGGWPAAEEGAEAHAAGPDTLHLTAGSDAAAAAAAAPAAVAGAVGGSSLAAAMAVATDAASHGAATAAGAAHLQRPGKAQTPAAAARCGSCSSGRSICDALGAPALFPSRITCLQRAQQSVRQARATPC